MSSMKDKVGLDTINVGSSAETGFSGGRQPAAGWDQNTMFAGQQS